MFEFFDFIVNMINTVVVMVQSLITTVINFFQILISGIAFVSSTILMLPPFCKGIILTLVSLSIITMLISFFVDNS